MLSSLILIAFFIGEILGSSLVDTAQLKQRISDLEVQVDELEQQLEIKILGIYFSPRGSCQDQIIHWISRANVSIHILIYSFTLDPIRDALIEAHRKGVEVMIVFEKGQISKYSEYQMLKDAGVEVRNDTNPKLMHNKIMIIDNVIVVTGSYNWSRNAEEYNNENILIIRSTHVAAIYEEEFEKIWNESD